MASRAESRSASPPLAVGWDCGDEADCTSPALLAALGFLSGLALDSTPFLPASLLLIWDFSAMKSGRLILMPKVLRM